MTIAPPAPHPVQILTPTDPIVQITGLNVSYRRRRREYPALIDLDLRIGVGEVVAMVGESGSGKSTTASALLGLLPANGRITSGRVLLGGQDIVGAKERTLRALRGRRVGLIPQDPMVSLNPTRRVGSQLAEVLRLRGVPAGQIASDVQEFLERAGVPQPQLRARQYPHELSGGLRQRVLIAIALAGEPELIVADEPTSALDVTVQKRILDHLSSLVRERGISLLVITHDLAVAADLADRIVVLREGRVIQQGATRDVLGEQAQPYTRALVSAAPALAQQGAVLPRFDVRGQSVPAALLELVDIHKTFPARERRRGERGFNAVSGISLAVPKGQTHALVGESGCGKTTTLRIALGLESVSSGSVRFDGAELAGLSWRAARPLRRRMQLVHQNPFASLDPHFTVEQSIVEPLVSFGVGDRRSRSARARELLDQVALPESVLHRRPSDLSGGQRQRVAIARALSLEPELVLLDEPVSALDVLVQEQILTLLRELQERLGLTYLFVSHDLSVVAQLAHTVSVMSRGQIVESGPTARVFNDPKHTYTQELLAAVPGHGRAFGAATIAATEESA